MNQEEYIQWLEAKNGYCACPDLAELFKQRKKTGLLEEKCDSIKKTMSLNPLFEKDLILLESYGDSIEQLKQETKKYHAKLSLLHHKGKLQISVNSRLVNRHWKSAKTIECSKCNQQIDLVETS